MSAGPIVPARIEWREDAPYAPAFGDVYHPRAGAFEQARHVFLAGNGLPQRWRGRARFVIAETGFGLGLNFAATCQAWRDDPARCERLVYVAVEAHPPRRDDLARVHGAQAPLVQAWPPLVPGVHALDFEQGRVRLVLAFGDAAALLPELRFAADAFYLDGFAPARNPAMWDERVLRALGHRAREGATAATWSVARPVREGLQAAGFAVDRTPGIGGKREITVARLVSRRPAEGERPPARALVVGAGLAGAFCARALADEGWAVQVVERRAAPAAETSSNPGGIFHGTVHADDGPHARWLRAAALQAARSIAPRVAAGRVPGAVQGCLRLGELDTMQRLIQRHGLPPDWVQALDAEAASALAGVPLPGAAWCYPSGGWVDPAALVRDVLEDLPVVTGQEVAALDRHGAAWCLRDSAGRVIGEAEAVVLANAAGVQRLLPALRAVQWPVRRLRGQVSGWRGQPSPLRLPLAGGGYALPLPDGLLCGATQTADDEAAARPEDDAANFRTLARLTGLQPPAAGTFSQVGWRFATEDRLPVAGAVPADAPPARGEQVRHWPRVPGLHVATALGGRGITSAPLLGRLVAAQVAGTPWPVEQSLADALDPARWRARALRRQG